MPPYRRLPAPVPVLVPVGGRELPGTALGWRSQAAVAGLGVVVDLRHC